LFERYTASARRAISRAQEQASGSASSQIEPDDLLIGLLREHNIHRFIGSPETVDSIERRINSGRPTREPQISSLDSEHRVHGRPQAPVRQIPALPDDPERWANLPLSHTSKRVLEYAAEESEHLNHRHIGTEHILLGLLREKGTLAAMILNELGLEVGAIRKRLQTRT
jgi:ATP-dependent Clp protease ATP-binding subunit ClpC